MIIDFHTHVFPDKIAGRTIALLSEKGGIPPFSDGTVAGLVKRMEEGGVDIAVALPVLTSPSQFDSVNRFAAELNESFRGKDRRIISFAGIHPRCDDIEGKMRLIKDTGFLGVKIHPDYQGTFIDDEGYVRIVRCASELDLIVVTHAGVDAAYPDTVHCPPDRALRLIRRAPHSKLVLAHLGGNEMANEVIGTLAGEDVYLDTAYVLRGTARETFLRILEKHGSDKILFATDSPWSDVRGDVEILKAFGLDEADESRIFYENAAKLLGI